MNEGVGEKILVVDDAPQNVKLLRLILNDAGYRVAAAGSGSEALERVNEDPPAAVILDVRMPGMSGFEVCEALRRDRRFAKLPVIMVTALSMPEERVRGIEAGASDFITKPFNKKELMARLEAVLAAARDGGGDGAAVLGQLPGSLLIAAPDWHLLAASPAAARVLELSTEQLLGTDLLERLEREHLHPPADDPRGFADSWEFQLCIHGRQVSALHTPVRTPQGALALRMVTLQEGAAC